MDILKPELKVSVFSDYICPFCYFGSRRVLRLRDEFDLKVNWCGLEIHPETPAAGMPVEHLGYSADRWSRMQQALQHMARDEHIDMTARTFTTNSQRALLLAEAAKQAGTEAFYALHEGLFHAYFVEGRNIGDPAVLEDLAASAGLAPDLVHDAWRAPRYRQRLALNLRHARELGVSGTPAYVFGDNVIVGAVPYADLHAAAHALARAPARPA